MVETKDMEQYEELLKDAKEVQAKLKLKNLDQALLIILWDSLLDLRD